jgi:hypothetical protein
VNTALLAPMPSARATMAASEPAIFDEATNREPQVLKEALHIS